MIDAHPKIDHVIIKYNLQEKVTTVYDLKEC